MLRRKQAPNVIIPCFPCMLILLLYIVCLSDSKQILFTVLVFFFPSFFLSRGHSVVCFTQSRVGTQEIYIIVFKCWC